DARYSALPAGVSRNILSSALPTLPLADPQYSRLIRVSSRFDPTSDPVTVWEYRKAVPTLPWTEVSTSESHDVSPRRSDPKLIVHSGAGGGGSTEGSGDGSGDGDGSTLGLGSTPGLGSTTGLGSGSSTIGGTARTSPASPVRPASKPAWSTGGGAAWTLEVAGVGEGAGAEASATARGLVSSWFPPRTILAAPPGPPPAKSNVIPAATTRSPTPLDTTRAAVVPPVELTASGTAACATCAEWASRSPILRRPPAMRRSQRSGTRPI